MNLDTFKNRFIKKYRNYVCPLCGKICTFKSTSTYKKFTCSCGYKETRFKEGGYLIEYDD